MSARIAVLAATAAMLATPAAAQRETQLGSRVNPRASIVQQQDPKMAAAAGHRYAGCAYLKQRAEATAVLDATTQEEASRWMKRLVSKGTCINLLVVSDLADSQRMQIPGDIYRGLLAEEAITMRFRGQTLEPLKLQATYDRPWFDATGRPRDIDEMSVCVADIDPAGVQRLLVTTAETDSERAAVRALAPSLGPCLASGTKLSSNRQSLRAGLAEALYHRFATPAAMPVASVK